MKIDIDKYEIQISEESNCKNDSIESKFDKYYGDKDTYQFNTQLGIKVYEKRKLIASAMVCGSGGGTGIHEKSQLIDNGKIIICCSNQVFNLSIPNLNLNWQTKADEGTCLEIFKLNQDFIIHGELEISRISNDGKIIWQCSGADIFVTKNNKEDFKITDKYIFATDWEDRRYVYDFEGNKIDDEDSVEHFHS